VTLNHKNVFNKATVDRIKLMHKRAQVKTPRPECDLIVKGELLGKSFGGLLKDNGKFVFDSRRAAPLSLQALSYAAAIKGNTLTFTCAPPGSGYRMGLDRDEDGILDGDER